jgi:hypothetical protein
MDKGKEILLAGCQSLSETILHYDNRAADIHHILLFLIGSFILAV